MGDGAAGLAGSATRARDRRWDARLGGRPVSIGRLRPAVGGRGTGDTDRVAVAEAPSGPRTGTPGFLRAIDAMGEERMEGGLVEKVSWLHRVYSVDPVPGMATRRRMLIAPATPIRESRCTWLGPSKIIHAAHALQAPLPSDRTSKKKGVLSDWNAYQRGGASSGPADGPDTYRQTRGLSMTRCGCVHQSRGLVWGGVGSGPGSRKNNSVGRLRVVRSTAGAYGCTGVN